MNGLIAEALVCIYQSKMAAAYAQAVWTRNMLSKHLLSTISTLSTFGFQAVEIPVKSAQLSSQPIDTDISCSFKPKDGANLSVFALNHLFEKKMGFDNVHKDIKALYPNITMITVVFDQQQHYKTLKLYVATHATHSQHHFKKVAGEQGTSIFNIIKKYKLLSYGGLNLNKDNAQTLNKKVYLDTQTQEADLTKETREELLQDLDKKLLHSLPELMISLNFNQEKQDKINKTIAHMKLNKLPLSTIGVDIDSHEIKLYFDYGQ